MRREDSIQDPVVAAILKQMKDYRSQDVKRISDLEKWKDKFDKDYIHDNYRLQDMISSAVSEGIAPLLERTEAAEKRLLAVEQRPQALSYKFVKWIVAGMGTVIISLIIALVRLSLKI